MKVLYDFDGFKNRYGGVARCTVELIANLPADIQYELAISVSKNAYLKKSGIAPNVIRDYIDVDNFLPHLHFKGKGRLFNLIESNFKSFPTFNNINKPLGIQSLINQDFDVFHCTSTDCDTYFLEYLKDKPFVLTVHDMISELFGSENNRQVQIKKQLVPRAKHIVAVSQQTKKDLINILNVPEDKITVIYHGAPNPLDFKKYSIIDAPYYLFVGNRHAYKNFTQTLKDFAKFHCKYNNVKLVTVGSTFREEEKSLISNYHLNEAVINISASDEQLYNLYRNAIAFIFPSLYEGFGIPILEAFAFGCPALLNDTSCFPEIAGPAAVFFHSRPDENTSDLPEKMEYIYKLGSSERDKLINNGFSRASLFNWKKSSEQLADVFRKCVD